MENVHADVVDQLKMDLRRAARWIRTAALAAIAGATAFVGCSTVGCAAFPGPKAVDAALKASEIACVLLQQSTDSKLVMQLCRIDNAFAPLVEELIAGKAVAAQRVAAERGDAGVVDQPGKGWGY